jgi:two-component system chemotaxis sensor kinase CheA
MLRVDAERIDNVLNLVGELIIGKSMMQQAVQEFARRFPKDSLRARFADAMGFQSRVLNDLQRSVMKIRMVPVEQLFRRFPRIVRDAAQRCEKQVELVISGHDTDLDKSLLDAIAEPLTHIVRNSVSHGIESADDRARAGKPATGVIRLDAYHQANQLVVEVSDDGRGIDTDKVKAKAVKSGIIQHDAAAKMSQAEILNLIFRPGFSTAEEITAVSGRGVGLDVVHSVLQHLKGSVEIETHPGKGTKFRLKLPLTLAIIKALMFRIEGKLYAIPLNTVAEISRTNESEVHNVENWEVVQLRGQVLPLMRLGARPPAVGGDAKIFVLIINFGARKLGLIVDSLEGEEELVIKSLDDQTVATNLVSGASILGDGRVVLIMNLTAVVERFTAHVGGRGVSGPIVPEPNVTSRTPEVLQ